MPILDMPFIPQWSLSANKRINDCGPACVLMILGFYSLNNLLTVDSLALETTLRYADTGLMPITLVKLLARHGLASYVHVGTTEDDLRREIDAGRPVIALLAYRYILNRLDQADNKPGSDGHFLNVIGYDDTHFICDDPDVWAPYVERGHNTFVPVTELKRALTAYSGQCIFMEKTMTLSEQIIALLKQAEVLAAQIDSAPPPVPPHAIEPPLPGTPKEGITLDSSTIRSETMVSNVTYLGALLAGKRIKYQGSEIRNGHTWGSLLEVDGAPRTYVLPDGRVIYGVFALDAAFPKV
jgi:peptidase C39-like protein